jgi:hypothetical protein
MPLKIDDLKTVESYKKAIKQDVTRISASGNTKFWIYKDIELPAASGGKQKLPALISLVDDTATKAVLKGKQPLCRGTCGLEGGKIAFEAAQGKVPYAVLTKSVPLLLGKMVHIPSGADAESDGEEAPGARPSVGAGSGQAAGTPYAGIVKYRGALFEFAQAKDKVQGQIRGLQSAIVARLPQEAAFAKDLVEEIEGLNQELAGAVNEAMKAAENEASPATDAIKLKIRKYQTELASNSLIAKADSNPFGVAVTIGKTLGDALARIRAAMPA